MVSKSKMAREIMVRRKMVEIAVIGTKYTSDEKDIQKSNEIKALEVGGKCSVKMEEKGQGVGRMKVNCRD